jgi:hypothetical protein
MEDESPIPSLLATLLDANRAAFEARAHEVAFHALSAAGHAAEMLEDLDALAEVERRAREELAWIDANDPGHRHSSSSAQVRGHHSIFHQLTITAGGMRKRIQADQRIHRAHGTKS